MISEKKSYLLRILFLLMIAGCATSSKNGPQAAPELVKPVKYYPISDERIKSFNDSIRPLEGEITAKYDLAKHFQKMGNHRIAIEALKELIKITPDHAAAHNAMGISYDCLGSYDLAQQHYITAIKLKPEMDHVYNNLGYSFLLQGDFTAAIKALKQAVIMNDANARYHKNLGLAYFKNNEMEMAVVEFRKIKDTVKAEEIMAQLEILSRSGKAVKEEKTGKKSPAAASPDAAEVARHDQNGIQTVEVSLTPAEINPVALDAAPAVQASVEPASVEDAVFPDPGPVIVSKAEPTAENAKIEVSNGNGVAGMAQTVGDYLINNGLDVHRITNADNFNHTESVIYYRDGFIDQAERIKDLLPDLSGDLVAAKLNREHVRVLIGHDLVPFALPSMNSVRIDLTNGNGVNGMARRLGQYLTVKGFTIGRLTNAGHYNYRRTIIFHSKNVSAQAKLVAEALPEGCNSRSMALDNSNGRVQVILGADLKL